MAVFELESNESDDCTDTLPEKAINVLFSYYDYHTSKKIAKKLVKNAEALARLHNELPFWEGLWATHKENKVPSYNPVKGSVLATLLGVFNEVVILNDERDYAKTLLQEAIQSLPRYEVPELLKTAEYYLR